MSKNIFIAGVARSGKSTIAEKLCSKLGYNHYPTDYIVASLKRNFPECNIKSNVVVNEENSSSVSKLLSTIIDIIDDKDEKFILDSAHVMPKDIIKYLDKTKWDIYYLGYPNISVNEKFSIIREYDKDDDWTNRKTDEELFEIVNSLIEISNNMKKECEELDIKFIDTSFDFEKRIDASVLEIYNKMEENHE